MNLAVKQALAKLGFFEKEADILMFLIRRKIATAEEIETTFKFPFDQATTLLNGLCASGMVERRNHGKVFELCGEERFSGWVSDQARKTVASLQEANDTMQTYFREIEENAWRPDMSYYEGKKGIRAIYANILALGEPVRGWTDMEKIEAVLGQEMDVFIHRRIERGIHSYAIMPETPFNREYTQKEQSRTVRFCADLAIEGETRVYGNKVAHIVFQGETPYGYIVTSQMNADNERRIFESHWQALGRKEPG